MWVLGEIPTTDLLDEIAPGHLSISECKEHNLYRHEVLQVQVSECGVAQCKADNTCTIGTQWVAVNVLVYVNSFELTSHQKPCGSVLLNKQSIQYHMNSNSSLLPLNAKPFFFFLFKQHSHVLCLHYSDTGTIRQLVWGGVFVHRCWLAKAYLSNKGWREVSHLLWAIQQCNFQTCSGGGGMWPSS